MWEVLRRGMTDGRIQLERVEGESITDISRLDV